MSRWGELCAALSRGCLAEHVAGNTRVLGGEREPYNGDRFGKNQLCEPATDGQTMPGIEFLQNAELFRAADLVGAYDIIPDEPGVYAWFFSSVPPRVPVKRCFRRSGATLLYVGIAPRRRLAGSDRTKRTLRTRIKYHLRGNVSGSTLRHTLAALLRHRLKIEPRLRPSGRFTIGDGEQRLDAWLDKHAFVLWQTCERNWELEQQLMDQRILPLNLRGNARNVFAPKLAALRRDLAAARGLGAVPPSLRGRYRITD